MTGYIGYIIRVNAMGRNSARAVLTIMLLFLSLVCRGKEEPLRQSDNMAGFGLLFGTSPYRETDSTTIPVPIIFWRSHNFFVEGMKAGYTFWQKKSVVRMDIFAAPRFMGYDGDDSAFLDGMRDRKYSLDAGIKARFTMPRACDCFLNLSLATDILSRHDGQEAILSFSKQFKHPYFIIEPSIGLKWQSSNLVEYYYGVQADEISSVRREYFAHDAFNYLLAVQGGIGLSRDITATILLSCEVLDNSIQNSPITKSDYIISFVFGITRRF